MRIMLCCVSGLSTSIAMKRMQQAAEKQNKNYQICAKSFNFVEDELGNFDVLLLGPQIKMKEKEIREIVKDKAAVAIMPQRDYALGNGESLLKFAEEVFNEFNESRG